MDRVAWAGGVDSEVVGPVPAPVDVGINPGLGVLDPEQLGIAQA